MNQKILSETTFRNALNSRGETDLFNATRECSWADFNALPMPNRNMEEWRFAKISEINFNDYTLPTPSKEIQTNEILEKSKLIEEPAGTLIFADDQLIAGTLSEEAHKAGVILAPLNKLSPEQIEKIRPYFFLSGGGICSEKLAALHSAYTNESAYLLQIPKEAKFEKPFVIYNWSCENQSASFPYAIILAEENSSAKFANFYLSAEKCSNSLVISRMEIIAKPGANITRKNIQALNESAQFYHMEWTHTHSDANVRGIAINLGAKHARTTTELRLEGKNANAELFSLAVADSTQEIDQRTTQRHLTPNATSNILFKNALLDQARTIFGGNIVVPENAQQTKAIQSNRNLILSKEAESHSIPGLEINANDVQCSHGATNGTLDPEQLFYLLQRGLPLNEARNLLVYGFMEEIVSQIEDPSLAESVRELIRRKFVKEA